MGAQRLLVEDATERPAVVSELLALEASSSVDGSCYACAVTFLEGEPGSHIASAAVLGQAIVVTFPVSGASRSFVYEASFRLPREPRSAVPLLNNYLPLARDLVVDAGGGSHRLQGIHFSGQNGVTSVCAHSALRMVAHVLGGLTLSSEHLERLIGLPSKKGGVSIARLRKAIASQGTKPVLYDFQAEPSIGAGGGATHAPWRILASTVEAGFPALLIVQTGGAADHVLPVLGYTMNTDEWHPHTLPFRSGTGPAYLSSTEWIDHLVVNDDMAGPYHALSPACIADVGRGFPGRATKPRAAMVILPKGIQVTPWVAEETAFSHLERLLPRLELYGSRTCRWLRDLASGGSRIVLRTTLSSRSAYIEHVRGIASATGVLFAESSASAFDRMAAKLPERLWVCEVSLPNLFAGNRAKLGEVLISVKAQKGDAGGKLLGFRLPSLVGWSERANSVQVTRLGIEGHAKVIGCRDAGEW